MNWPIRAFCVVLGIGAIVGATRKDAGLRHGMMPSGPCTYTLTPVGRVCIILIGALMIFVGLTGITEFWRF